ncbi:MAG: hypothetical protein ASUL_08984 [Candidatus Aramenus sulfurataquae]|jgi:hypothetical protein|uniref:Uncharacterized protein n=1 Tax=Candidatus Aramenus sulfurataquae TaxID=1326980 RepID=W7L4L1_9CREN|nr:MAG: hypothetical protein ASUL_08984 [Candidatus Aramenus sulfurataquae]
MAGELVDIDYDSSSLWDQYIKEDVMRVYVATSKVLNLYRQAESYIDLTYDKLDHELKKILVGGVIRREDGSFGYTENSSAKFYADVIGLSLEDYNAYVHSVKTNVFVPIRLKVTKGFKSSSVQEMNNLAKKIISAGGVHPPESVSRVPLNNLNQVIETFKELLEALVNFASVYNPKTFFVTTLTGSTLKAFLEAYDKLNNKEVMNAVFKRFGVQTLVDFSQLTGQKEFNIVGYTNVSLGRHITSLDKLAYDFLRDFKTMTSILYLESNIEMDYKSLLSHYINSTPLGRVLEFTWWWSAYCYVPRSSNDFMVTCENAYSKSYYKYRTKKIP